MRTWCNGSIVYSNIQIEVRILLARFIEQKEVLQLTKDKGGRPSVMTKDTLQKLESAFLFGFSDREACLYAEIAPATLYKYCKENTGFSERKELLKEQPKMRAKIKVVQAIEKGDTKMARWYLERKDKEEFGTTQAIELSGGIDLGGAAQEIDDFIQNRKAKEAKKK